MKKKISMFGIAAVMLLAAFSFFTEPIHAASIALSADQQWIDGLSTQYEYITSTTYDKHSASAANNAYWTSLSPSGGTRPDGSKYAAPELVSGHKLQVNSAWYGQDVYFRTRGSYGKGTVVKIPEYTQLKEQYKKAIKVFNAYSSDTGDSFYGHYIENITDSNGYLKDTNTGINIHVAKLPIEVFNRQPLSVLTDAEGNYIYDLVAIGVYTNSEPDISGAAAWVLRDYISEGYGFLIGHDTMYGYGGVNPDPNYTPNANDTTTPMYVNNTKINGHWNMNWLMGVNKLYTQATPWEAASMILNIGDYTDKSTLYGDDITYSGGISELRIAAVTPGNPLTDVAARCPTNYPYSSGVNGLPFNVGSQLVSGATHSNQQLAYGKVWLDFKSNTTNGKLLIDKNAGFIGTNNFYLTTNGNFGMVQIGHSKDNINTARPSEARILANTIMYLSQRQPCQICQSKQGCSSALHAVKRITSAAELSNIGKAEHWFTYPTDGCYVLVADIELPTTWTPIKGFAGHFNADNHKISTNGKAVFEQKGVLGSYNLVSPLSKGWNLGTDSSKGLNKISNGGGVLTGVARVEGYINALFGTPSEIDYSGYKVVITDNNGVSYDCATNREGKYVVSNLPCTGLKFSARIYTPSGTEVTQYGAAYAQIPQSFWNTSETIPLQLNIPKAIPVPDIVVYEEHTAVFNASVTGTATQALWEYKISDASGWINIKYADFEYRIGAMTTLEGKTFSSLTVNNAKLASNGTLFRAIFTVNGNQLNTFDEKTPKNSGKLTVLERPLTIVSPSESKVWEGEDLVFTATGKYYKSLSSGVIVVWQFRGNSNCVWENVGGSSVIKDAFVSQNVKYTGDNIQPYDNTSTLVIKNASLDYKGYEFRAVFKYPIKSKVWQSNEAKAEIIIKTINCTKNPSNIKIELTDAGTVPSGATSTYTADFTYVGKTSDRLVVQWEARNGATADYVTIPSSIVTQQNVSSPQATGKTDEYRVTATMTVTNPNSSMDKDNTHYFFRAKGTLQSLTAYSNSADLSINYRIDIVEGEPTMTKRDDAGYDFSFKKLRIVAPNGLRSVRVKYTNSSHPQNRITYPALPWAITARTEGPYIVFDSSYQHSAATWEIFLRELVFTVYSAQEKIYWYIDELQTELEYNPDTGKYEKHEYEFVYAPNITWTQAYSSARSKYSYSLQTYGKLVTIKDAKENAKAQATLGGWAKGWIGATSDRSYNGWNSDMRWHTGEVITWGNQRPDTPWGYPYMFMYPIGSWSRAPNVNNVTVTTTDVIDWWAPWEIGGDKARMRFHTAENLTGEVYTGIGLDHEGGWDEYNTTATKKVYLETGHNYWFSSRFGESGDSNTSMILNFPALGISGYSELNTFWHPTDFSQVEIAGIYGFTGATGYYDVTYSTVDCLGSTPSSGQLGYGQVFYLDIIDLTKAFGANIDKATTEWCRDNLRAKSGSQTFQFTSNVSTMEGYIVEYERNDFGFGRTNHSADTEGIVNKPKEWTAGREGVRVTVVDAKSGKPYKSAFDLSSLANTDVTRHFGYKSKTEYQAGASLKVNSERYVSTIRALPKVIVPGSTNRAQLMTYFQQDENLNYIASRVGLTKAQLTAGRYKILLEPVIYLPLSSGIYAMTATEMAMYNAEHDGVIYDAHKNVTHQALPFSLFLTENDLGFKAWKSSVSQSVSDGAIIQDLGIGILRFGAVTPLPNITDMRTSTQVYLSCDVTTNGKTPTTPDSPAWVRFSVNGETITHNNITLPAGASQRAYVKWTTPNVAGQYKVQISCSPNVQTNISEYLVNISQIVENTPPDPTANDRNDYYVRPLSLPPRNSVLGSNWLEYSCKKENGNWKYTPLYYNARLTLSIKLQPDERVPTATQNDDEWEMKSGYGINMNVYAKTTGSTEKIINAQTAISYFPEFLYSTYNRVLNGDGGFFSFKPNIYSQWENNVHFTPLWFPDGTYTPIVYIRDVWTPAGELRDMGNATIQIKGSVFDDWYVAKG